MANEGSVKRLSLQEIVAIHSDMARGQHEHEVSFEGICYCLLIMVLILAAFFLVAAYSGMRDPDAIVRLCPGPHALP